MTPDEIVLGRFARSLIGRKARRLAGDRLFPDMDPVDLVQELTLRLLGGLRNFDACRARTSAAVHAFVATVVDRAADQLVRERLAAKRAARVASLDADAACEPADPVAAAVAGERDRDLDIAAALAALPPELVGVAEALLRSENVAAAARRRRVARSSFVRQIERLRRHLEDGGLREYLE